MAWVPPWPGMAMGRPARWLSRLMGITTFCPPVPSGPATVVDVEADGDGVVDRTPSGATPSAVTT